MASRAISSFDGQLTPLLQANKENFISYAKPSRQFHSNALDWEILFFSTFEELKIRANLSEVTGYRINNDRKNSSFTGLSLKMNKLTHHPISQLHRLIAKTNYLNGYFDMIRAEVQFMVVDFRTLKGVDQDCNFKCVLRIIESRLTNLAFGGCK